MSSKVVSYFDWQIGFRSNSTDNTLKFKIAKKPNMNSIGISDDKFKKLLSKWKKKNLS